MKHNVPVVKVSAKPCATQIYLALCVREELVQVGRRK